MPPDKRRRRPQRPGSVNLTLKHADILRIGRFEIPIHFPRGRGKVVQITVPLALKSRVHLIRRPRKRHCRS